MKTEIYIYIYKYIKKKKKKKKYFFLKKKNNNIKIIKIYVGI